MELLQFSDTSLINTQCLVCSTTALTSYIDLALDTSCTSHSEIPVKEKVKNILNDKWISALSESSFILCLPCFHLVDQFDGLETQLKIIQEEICNKYISSHCIIPTLPPTEKFVMPDQQNDTLAINGDKTKKTSISKRNATNKRRKSITETLDDLNSSIQVEELKKDKQTEAFLEWHTGSVTVYDTNIPPGNQLLVTSLPTGGTLPMTWTDGDGTSLRIVTLEGNPADTVVAEQSIDDPGLPSVDGSLTQVEEEEDKMPSVVYDDGLDQMKPGERMRIGVAATPDSAPGAFVCCYCGDLFLDVISIKLHARSAHRPVVLTSNLPPHLGLGPHANCGVQVANITATGDHAKPYVCIFCDGAFKFKSNIHLHYKEKHTPHKPFSCPDCQEAFRRSMELSRHRVYYCPYRKKSGSETKSSR